MLQVLVEGQWAWMDEPTLAEWILAGRLAAESPAREAPDRPPRPLFQRLSTGLLQTLVRHLGERLERAGASTDLVQLDRTVSELLNWPWPVESGRARCVLHFYRGCLSELLGRTEEALGAYSAFLVSVPRDLHDAAQQVALNNRALLAISLGSLAYLPDLIDLLRCPPPAAHYAAANLFQLREGATHHGWGRLLERRLVRILADRQPHAGKGPGSEPGEGSAGKGQPAPADDVPEEQVLQGFWQDVTRLADQLALADHSERPQPHAFFSLLTRERVPAALLGAGQRKSEARWIAAALLEVASRFARNGQLDMALATAETVPQVLQANLADELRGELQRFEQLLQVRRFAEAERLFANALGAIGEKLEALAEAEHDLAAERIVLAADARLRQLATSAQRLGIDAEPLVARCRQLLEKIRRRRGAAKRIEHHYEELLQAWSEESVQNPVTSWLSYLLAHCPGDLPDGCDWETRSARCRQADAASCFDRALQALAAGESAHEHEVERLLGQAVRLDAQWASKAAVLLCMLRFRRSRPQARQLSDPCAELTELQHFFDAYDPACAAKPLFGPVAELLVRRLEYLSGAAADQEALRSALRTIARTYASQLLPLLPGLRGEDVSGIHGFWQQLAELCPDRFDLGHPVHEAQRITGQWLTVKEAESALAAGDWQSAEAALERYFDGTAKDRRPLAYALWLAVHLLSQAAAVIAPLDWTPQTAYEAFCEAAGRAPESLDWRTVRDWIETTLRHPADATHVRG